MRAKYPYYAVEPITDLQDMFWKSVDRFGRRIALQIKTQGAYRPMTYTELGRAVQSLSAELEAMGIRPGDRVAILSENRPEWAISYLAIATGGAVCVPIDKELREQEVFQTLYLSEARFAIASERWVEMLTALQSRLSRLERIINMDSNLENGIALSFGALLRSGSEPAFQPARAISAHQVKPGDLAALIYTSGTMGNPKGVMLSHRNLATSIMDTCRSVYVDERDRFLSVLPLHHTYECTCGFLVPLYRGATISYGEHLRRLAENLVETRSTVLLGVPLLFETIYKKIMEAISERGEGRFKFGMGIANLTEALLRLNLRKFIFRTVHQRFGGHLRLLICGGAAVNPRVARGFRQLGIPFLQGYGMTEASPLIAVNRDRAFRDDAAGLPLESTDIRIEEDEILVRGDNVMQAYYCNPEATAEAIREGWLHTGDLGSMDKDGFLHILGRKKLVIVTKGGKNVYPEEIEAELLKSPYILECMVWGGADPREAEVQAILVPNKEYLASKAGGDPRALDRDRIEPVIREEVRRCNRQLAPYKAVKRFTIRDGEFEKTTTRKIKRYLYTGETVES
ncbi:MAG: AMP-binding protein [Acidobacteria bacterium]|nr:AMP-binding protein [Acidobacteriota bacterium]